MTASASCRASLAKSLAGLRRSPAVCSAMRGDRPLATPTGICARVRLRILCQPQCSAKPLPQALPAESKNIFLRDDCSMIARDGTPSTSMMHASCSASFSPGKSGYLHGRVT